MIRMVFLGLVFLTIVYFCLSLYSHQVRKGKLKQWYQDSDKSLDMETYVQQGLEKYNNSLRRKLILLVYIVPIVAVCTLIYVTNLM